MTVHRRTSPFRSRHLFPGVLLALIAVLVVRTGTWAATGWTGPRLVGPVGDCASVRVAIDGAGHAHLVASCGERVRYSTNETGPWRTTFFSAPSRLAEIEPQVAIDRNRVYVAVDRGQVTPGLSCREFTDSGVYVRSRSLGSTAWSAAVLLGVAGDELESFTVAGGKLAATVLDSTSHLWYETMSAGVLHRIRIADGTGDSSVRIGSDGVARIAYESATRLRIATATGSGLSTATIPGTTAVDGAPQLALDATNHAHVVWTHGGFGCAGDLGDRTEAATDASGSWTPVGARLVTAAGSDSVSLVLKSSGGRVSVAVGGTGGLFVATQSGQEWSVQKLTSAPINAAAVGLNQASGHLLVAYARTPAAHVAGSVFAFTQP
jgi:hypothetical protein